MRTIEPPVVTNSESNLSETVETHPAYGQIAASRVSGSAYLYGSDFKHNNYITITVRRSERHRGLSRDWFFGRSELVEVALSEAQWATFVSSLNQGMGVPCTIQFEQGKGSVPGLPAIPSRADQFKQEAKAKLDEAFTILKELSTAIDVEPMRASTKKTLLGKLERVKMQLQSNLPFVAKSFGEHVEDTIETAKVEVHAYMNAVIQRMGLSALKEKLPFEFGAPKQQALEGEKKED